MPTHTDVSGGTCRSCKVGTLARHDAEMLVPIHSGFHNPATGSGLRYELRRVPTLACNCCEYVAVVYDR